MTISIVQNERYKVHRLGLFRWGVRAGNGDRVVGTRLTRIGAMRLAAELQTAYLDGVFVAETANDLRGLLGTRKGGPAPDSA